MTKIIAKILAEPPKIWGRRGSVLFLMGTVWVLMGVSVLVSTPRLTFEDTDLWHLSIPPIVRALMWFTTGAVAVIFSVRYFAKLDGIGYGALVIMPLERAASYAWAWFVSLPVWPEGLGYPSGWTTALVWGVIVTLIYTCAGWREPLNEPVLIIEQREAAGGHGSDY